MEIFYCIGLRDVPFRVISKMQHEIASEPCRMGLYLENFSINSMMVLIKTNSLTRNEILIQLNIFLLFVPSTPSALKRFDSMSTATFKCEIISTTLINNLNKNYHLTNVLHCPGQ